MSRIVRPLAARLLLALAVLTLQPAALRAHAEPLAPASLAQAGAAAEPGPIVAQAFNLLMDRFVIPPGSADVLNGGWTGGVAILAEHGVEVAPTERPTFTNEREADLRLFTTRYARLAAAAEGKLDRAELDRAIVRGMARAMDEGHTAYLSPEEARAFGAQLRNDVRYVGIGVRPNQDNRVVEVFEASPAEASGIRLGDRIVAVDGVPVDGLTPAEVSARVRGEPGTPVEVAMRREGRAEPIVFRLVRAEVKVSWVAERVTDDGIGYLRLRSFPVPSELGEFRAAMERLDGAGIRALVIDVRGNGGGSIETGIEVAGRFMRDEPLFQRVDRSGRERTTTAWGDYWNRTMPIAVLTDGGSASMSEILAAAIQESGLGTVIGTRTAGVVATGVPYPLSDGSLLYITVEVIKTGQGKDLNRIGLEPDRTIELDGGLLGAGRDSQLDAALEHVRAAASGRAAGAAPTDSPPPSFALPAAA